MFEKYEKLILIDFETSGLDFEKDRIIEIGMLTLERNKETNKFDKKTEFNKFIKLDFIIPQEIVDLTNITNEMLMERGVLEEEIYKKIKDVINKDNLLIAYNIQFDAIFLNNLMKRYDKNFNLHMDFLDVYAIYKDRYSYPHKLKHCIETYKVDIPNSHRAIDDIKATFECLKKMILQKNNIELYINKLGYNSKYGVSGEKFSHIEYISQGFNGVGYISNKFK